MRFIMRALDRPIRARIIPAKTWAAGLALACLFALNGCAALQVKLGMKVYLAQTPVSSMEVRLPKGPAIAPGQKAPLVVAVTEPDGKVLLTEGQGGGKVMWKDLQVTATIVSVNNKGVVSLRHDPRVSDERSATSSLRLRAIPTCARNSTFPFDTTSTTFPIFPVRLVPPALTAPTESAGRRETQAR